MPTAISATCRAMCWISRAANSIRRRSRQLATIDPAWPAPCRWQSAHRRLRRRHRQVHLHRPELLRSRRRDGRHGAAGADHLHEGHFRHRRPRRRRGRSRAAPKRPTGKSNSPSSSAGRRNMFPKTKRSIMLPATASRTMSPNARSRSSATASGPRARAATRSARSARGW